MKVFIDTNVWLSARFRPGLCSDLIEALLIDNIPLVVDERVLVEFERIARVKLHVDEPLLKRTMRFFHRYACVVPGAEKPADDIPDPDDAWIIASALAARADWFVTGDKALLSLGRIGRLELLDPRTAYQRLRGPA